MKEKILSDIVKLFDEVGTTLQKNYCLYNHDESRMTDIFLPNGCAILNYPASTCIDIIIPLEQDDFSSIINKYYSDYYENRLVNAAVIVYDETNVDRTLLDCFEGRDDVKKHFLIYPRLDSNMNPIFEHRTISLRELKHVLSEFIKANDMTDEKTCYVESDGVCYSDEKKIALTHVPETISSFTIPNTVKKIGCGAFFNCNKLQNVILPDDLQIIKPFAFKNCKLLEGITIPNGVHTIGISAFAGCKSLSRVDFLGNKLSKIEMSVFSDSGVSSICLPNNVIEIGNSAFKDCMMLTDVVFNEKLDIIGDNAFEDCRQLKHCQMGDNVTIVGDGAFRNCYALQNVRLSRNLSTINNSLFFGCSSLICVENLNCATIIKEKAFKNCGSLKGVNLSKNVLEVRDSAFENCSRLERISQLSNFCKVSKNAFCGCPIAPEFRKRLFISYSWDSETHKQWVSQLAKYFNDHGFDVLLDEYLRYGDDLDNFMSDDIEKSNVVLLILTPNYKGRTQTETSGVYKEVQTIRCLKNNKRRDFLCVPILREGSFEESLPSGFSEIKGVEIKKKCRWKTKVDKLINQINGN